MRGLCAQGEGGELVSDNFSQSSRPRIVTIPIVTNYAWDNMAHSFYLLNEIKLNDYFEQDEINRVPFYFFYVNLFSNPIITNIVSLFYFFFKRGHYLYDFTCSSRAAIISMIFGKVKIFLAIYH